MKKLVITILVISFYAIVGYFLIFHEEENMAPQAISGKSLSEMRFLNDPPKSNQQYYLVIQDSLGKDQYKSVVLGIDKQSQELNTDTLLAITGFSLANVAGNSDKKDKSIEELLKKAAPSGALAASGYKTFTLSNTVDVASVENFLRKHDASPRFIGKHSKSIVKKISSKTFKTAVIAFTAYEATQSVQEYFFPSLSRLQKVLIGITVAFSAALLYLVLKQSN